MTLVLSETADDEMASPEQLAEAVKQTPHNGSTDGAERSFQEDTSSLHVCEPSVGPVVEAAGTQQGAGVETIQPLPPPSVGLAGSSSVIGKNFDVTVSNKAGYLCHVHVIANWSVPPEVPFAIFTHPDNSALFRDIKRVGVRKVLKTEPGYKEVQVEQLGEIQVLWMHRTYSTWLHVAEDSRDPDCLRTVFDLIKSDVLGKFGGTWELKPVHDPATGSVVGCRGELHQDVLPKGMPAFMARLPVLGSALRGASVRAVTRVMEDFNVAMDKVRAGHAAGRSTEAVLRELCGSVAETAHVNGAVTSFAFEPADDEDDADDEEQSADGARPDAPRAGDADDEQLVGIVDRPVAAVEAGATLGEAATGDPQPCKEAKVGAALLGGNPHEVNQSPAAHGLAPSGGRGISLASGGGRVCSGGAWGRGGG